jgi:REP element-mobilizing transposase RayT
MPRKARIDAPGAVQHIIIRGIEKKNIFRTDADRHNFLKRFGSIISDSETACYAWALMPNHIHLLLRTSLMPISTVMRRLLTGYAVSFNRKYRRHGHLFQNRYKSILCQEDPYLKELVRYIHLNPLRADLVPDMWQNVKDVLKLFGNTISSSRKKYRSFVEKGVAEGRRSELTGGGLIRSLGGWQMVKSMRRADIRFKGDERILGESEFVQRVLNDAKDRLERQYDLAARGYDFERVVARVAEVLDIDFRAVLRRDKQPQTVRARSLVCFWANRELGMSTVEISRRLQISQSAVSRAARRGEQIAAQFGFNL